MADSDVAHQSPPTRIADEIARDVQNATANRLGRITLAVGRSDASPFDLNRVDRRTTNQTKTVMITEITNNPTQ